jgi:hypothetical protein
MSNASTGRDGGGGGGGGGRGRSVLPMLAPAERGGDMFFAGTERARSVIPARRLGSTGGDGDFDALPSSLRGDSGGGGNGGESRRAGRHVLGSRSGVVRGGTRRSANTGREGGAGDRERERDMNAEYHERPRVGGGMEPGAPSVGVRTPRRGLAELDAAAYPGSTVAREGGGVRGGGGERQIGQLTEAEIKRHYERIELEALSEGGAHKDVGALWNGGRHRLCKLTRAANPDEDGYRDVKGAARQGTGAASASGDVDASRSCFLSRNYTEGMRRPTAFLAPPPLFVLCQACSDVAWEPIRDTRPPHALFCRACLRAAAGHTEGTEVARDFPEDYPEDLEVAATIRGLFVMCRNALAGTWTQAGALVWRLDAAGCPEIAKLGERETVEHGCMYAAEECGLPRGANPAECCQRRVRRRELTEHREGCSHRIVACSHEGCSRRIQARYGGNHARLCEQRPATCAHLPQCRWLGTRAGLDAHLETCAYEMVPCGLVDSTDDATRCGVCLPRSKVSTHRRVCQYQRGTCQFCGALESLRQLGKHEASCPQRHYVCRRCFTSVHALQARQHDAAVCPAVEVDCGYKNYGCPERLQRCDYAAHMQEDFHMHMRMVLVHTIGAGTEGSSRSASGVGGDEGFEALVTRHELTRADLRLLARTASEMATGTNRETALLLEEAARVEDQAGDAAQRLALEMSSSRAALAARITAVDADVALHENALQTRLLTIYNDSVGMRRVAERDLPAIGSLDEELAAGRSEFTALGDAQQDLLREVGAALLGLTAALSPAMQIRTRVAASQAGPLDACAGTMATMEWHSADRAVIAWERLQDLRNSSQGHGLTRRRACDQLEEKIASLEARRFITPDEDSALRKRSKQEVVARVRAKMSAVAKLAAMRNITTLLGSPPARGTGHAPASDTGPAPASSTDPALAPAPSSGPALDSAAAAAAPTPVAAASIRATSATPEDVAASATAAASSLNPALSPAASSTPATTLSQNSTPFAAADWPCSAEVASADQLEESPTPPLARTSTPDPALEFTPARAWASASEEEGDDAVEGSAGSHGGGGGGPSSGAGLSLVSGRQLSASQPISSGSGRGGRDLNVAAQETSAETEVNPEL